MWVLFTAALAVAVIFILYFLTTLNSDLTTYSRNSKRKAIRPFIVLFFAIGFWMITLPAYLAPDFSTTQTYSGYNITTTNTLLSNLVLINSTAIYPRHNVTISQVALPANDLYIFLPLWFAVLFVELFLLWWTYAQWVKSEAQTLLDEYKDD